MVLVSGCAQKKEKTLHSLEKAVSKQVRAKDGKLKVTDMMGEIMEGLHFLARLRSWQDAAKESSWRRTVATSLVNACFQQWVQVSETSKRIQKSRVRFVHTWIML